MLGILDIGSNTVHLLVLNPTPHAFPAPIAQERTIVPVMQHLDDSGAITEEGIDLLVDAVRRALAAAEQHRLDRLVGMATSALREIPNGGEVLRRLGELAGTEIRVLNGTEEAEFTFVAARRWVGWGAGRLLVCDIGGGSLQIAQGSSGLPDQAFSLPLGAGRLTHQFLHTDPTRPDEREALVDQVRGILAHITEPLTAHHPDTVLGTSKVLRSLGRLAGHAQPRGGRVLRFDSLQDWTERLGHMDLAQRLHLPGMTPERAHHIYAGAVTATELMRALQVDEMETCPWALREGLLLQYIDPLGGRTHADSE